MRKVSLAETRNSLIDGYQRKYLDEALYFRLLNLTRAADRLTTNLLLAKRRQAEREEQQTDAT